MDLILIMFPDISLYQKSRAFKRRETRKEIASWFQSMSFGTGAVTIANLGMKKQQ